MKRIAILISGTGTNMLSLCKSMIKEKYANPVLVLSDQKQAKGLRAAESLGINAKYIGVEQLNEDYVDFENKLFAPYHKESKSRLYWELNEIVDRTENAYKPVTHIITEILNPDAPEVEWNPTFAEEMAVKYGTASRKFHGTMNMELVHFAW